MNVPARTNLFIPLAGITLSQASYYRDIANIYALWNKHLLSRAQSFLSENAGISNSSTAFIFSARSVINEVLDHPGVFGLRNNDGGASERRTTDTGGRSNIWEDHIHMSPEVHTILAERIVEALEL